MKMHTIVLGLLAVGYFVSNAPAGTVTLTEIGSPTWKVVDPNLFAAPIGTGADGYAEFLQTQQRILPPPHYTLNPANGQIVPGTPEAGPYNSDISNGVMAQGYKVGSFGTSDFSQGTGIWVSIMLVPSAGAPTGSSPDYASGAVIPNSLYPIAQTGLTLRNGVTFDPNWAGQYGDVNSELGLKSPKFAGYSHQPFFFAESSDFGPAGLSPAGAYTSSWKLLDTSGNGWQINADYIVSGSTSVPLPPAIWAGLSTLVFVEYARRRRRLIVAEHGRRDL